MPIVYTVFWITNRDNKMISVCFELNVFAGWLHLLLFFIFYLPFIYAGKKAWKNYKINKANEIKLQMKNCKKCKAN